MDDIGSSPHLLSQSRKTSGVSATSGFELEESGKTWTPQRMARSRTGDVVDAATGNQPRADPTDVLNAERDLSDRSRRAGAALCDTVPSATRPSAGLSHHSDDLVAETADAAGQTEQGVDGELAKPNTHPPLVKALDRALCVLNHLVRHPGERLSDLALQQNVALATLYRTLITLEYHGYARSEADTQRWYLGPAAHRLAQSYVDAQIPLDLARPILSDLKSEIGETAVLTLADAANAPVVGLAVDSDAPMRVTLAPGHALPRHASAFGKAVLGSVDHVTRDPETGLFEALTHRTVTSPRKLALDLNMSRERGFFIDMGEFLPDVQTVASPVSGVLGATVGAIGLIGPRDRMARFPPAVIGAKVRAASERLTSALLHQTKTS